MFIIVHRIRDLCEVIYKGIAALNKFQKFMQNNKGFRKLYTIKIFK